jgi:hypothetical protein
MPLLDMYNEITKSIERSEFSIGVFIDLSKAFDTMNHAILFSKLEHYGIRGVTLNWFIDYLSNRQQYVSYNNSTSALKNIDCGVPQGSILGPILFLIYINDIVHSSNVLRFILFVDDTNLFCSNKSFTDLINVVNSELIKVCAWFRANKLSLNATKTNYICFGSRRKYIVSDPNVVVTIDGVKIEKVSHTKFLGVFIDERLNWKYHTSQVSLKICKSLGVLNRAKNVLSQKLLLTLYSTMIHPYLVYCNIVWGGASEISLHKLICLQKRALRIITNSPFRAASGPLFSRLSILRLPDVNRLLILSFMYRIKYNLLPMVCSVHITPNCVIHKYNLRRIPDYKVLSFRCKSREKYIGVLGPRL